MKNTKRCSNRRKRARSVVDGDESRNNGGVIEKRCCWSDLPSDLLETITSKLFFADQINFRAVCKSWHQVLVPPVPLKQMPWLMVFDDEEGKHSWNSCKLVDPTYKKTYTIDMSSLNKKMNLKPQCFRLQIHESKYGWLLMSCITNENRMINNSLILYSPFLIDNNIIELPVLDKYYTATFDDLNLTKDGKEDFQVLILSNYTDSIRIGTCRPGDNMWSWKEPLWKFSISEMRTRVYSEGIIYYASCYGPVQSGSYDIVRNKWTKFPAFLPVEPIDFNVDVVMIKCNGEIFLTYITNMRSPCWGSMNGSIYKLDASKGTWVSIPNLSDRAVFLGYGYSSILELDDDIDELKDQKQKVYFCFGSVLKHCNALGETRSYSCSKHYGSLARGNLFCRRIWIDPPRRPHIRNSL